MHNNCAQYAPSGLGRSASLRAPGAGRYVLMRLTTLLLPALMSIACTPWRGFLESEFHLAKESSLPSWVEPLPKGCNRDDVTIRLQYWSPPWDVNDVVLIAGCGSKTLFSKSGKSERPEEWYSWAREDWLKRHYPSFNRITIGGKTEVILHKKMEPIFYISDQQAIINAMESTN